MSWVHKCLKQNKNMRHFNGPVEHGQNLPPNLAEWVVLPGGYFIHASWFHSTLRLFEFYYGTTITAKRPI